MIETGLGAEDQGKEIALVGDGVQQTYARNTLFLRVRNLEMKGGYEHFVNNDRNKTHFLQWGVKSQIERVLDRLNDWEKLDSALYNLAHTEDDIIFKKVLKTKNELESYRFSGYVQDEYTIQKNNGGEIRFTGGIRASYWTLNKEFYLNPRGQVIFKPGDWEKIFHSDLQQDCITNHLFIESFATHLE